MCPYIIIFDFMDKVEDNGKTFFVFMDNLYDIKIKNVK
jgi:hypothetical protein